MLETYKIISDVWNKHSEIPDLRTAAMIVAVKNRSKLWVTWNIKKGSVAPPFLLLSQIYFLKSG